MNEQLVSDTPANQRSDEQQVEEMIEEMVEPSCCGPVRSKINTTPIKLHSIVYIVCGVLSVGLGITACVFECRYKGLSIPAGVLFIGTGIVGVCARKDRLLAVYGWLNLFCFLYGFFLLAFMTSAVFDGEKMLSSLYCLGLPPYRFTCDVRYSNGRPVSYTGCCQSRFIKIKWRNVGIDLSILVVGVIVMVTSLAAITFALRDVNCAKLCWNNNNMHEAQVVDSSQPESSGPRSEPAQSSPAMKRCWTPCDNKCHRIATIILSIIHIIIGVICACLGIAAIIVECRLARMGMPIWTGILIFMVTGCYGLLSTTKKGAYIPCFFAFSILTLVMSTNMFSWIALSIVQEQDCTEEECLEWCYYKPTGKHCCNFKFVCIENKEARFVDELVSGFCVLEFLVCLASIGLSFTQLNCYICCLNGCTTCKGCCKTKTNTAYQMMMTSDGNMMMVAVPNTQHGMTPSLVNNQQMIPQPMVIPANQLIAGQNQTSVSAVQPNIVGQLVEGNGQQEPIIAQGQVQPIVVQSAVAQRQMQPVVATGQGQPTVVRSQSQPMALEGKKQHEQPVFVQESTQPGIPTSSMFIQQPKDMGKDAVVQSQMQPNNQPVSTHQCQLTNQAATTQVQPVSAPQSQLTNQTVSTQVQTGSLPQGVEQPAVVSEDANQGIGVI